jgi:hypothetical protein
LLDFTGAIGSYVLDATLFQQKGYLSMVQTLYLDLSSSANALTVQVGSGGSQLIKAKPNTQGFYPILCPNPPNFLFQSTPGGVIIPIQLINIPIAGIVWATA